MRKTKITSFLSPYLESFSPDYPKQPQKNSRNKKKLLLQLKREQPHNHHGYWAQRCPWAKPSLLDTEAWSYQGYSKASSYIMKPSVLLWQGAESTRNRGAEPPRQPQLTSELPGKPIHHAKLPGGEPARPTHHGEPVCNRCDGRLFRARTTGTVSCPHQQRCPRLQRTKGVCQTPLS